MAVLIKHISEPYAGREIAIGDDIDEIRFGRDPSAEVGFPAELDVVSRDHFRLRREVGAWKFVIGKQRPVFAAGRALLDGEELDGPVEVQLSGPGGPRLRLEPRDAAAGNIPKTRVLAAGEDIGDIAQGARRGGRRLTLWLGGVTLAVVVAGGAIALLQRNAEQTASQVGGLSGQVLDLSSRVDAVDARIPTLEEQVAAAEAKAGAQLDAQAVLGRVSRSVYLVSWQASDGTVHPIGTASVVRMPDGTKALMTNAHITEPVIETHLGHPEYKTKVLVTQPLAPDYPTLQVVRAVTHPAYAPYGEWVARFMALKGESRVRDVQLQYTAYDVGLLFVSEPDKLGEPLTLATPDELAALDTGVPLAMTGYPGDGVAGTDPARPEPTAHVGTITAVTTFYLFRSTSSPNLLIQHSLATAGGASGSPMFNKAGHVVALHNATGSSNAMYAMINYGQRIDLLTELMDGSAAGKLDAYRREWAEQETKLTKSDPAAIVQDLRYDFAVAMNAELTSVGQKDFPMDQPVQDMPNAKGATFGLTLEPGFNYLLVAQSQDKRPIMASAFIGNERVLGSVGGYFISSLTIYAAGSGVDRLTIALLDESSTGNDAVTPGVATVQVWKATAPR